MRRYSAYNANHVMTTTAATSMISKNNTTTTSLVARRCASCRGAREAAPRRDVCARRGMKPSGDLDVDLVDARAGRCDAGVTIARGGQRAQRPGARCREEP